MKRERKEEKRKTKEKELKEKQGERKKGRDGLASKGGSGSHGQLKAAI
jgi:hypothetical protein